MKNSQAFLTIGFIVAVTLAIGFFMQMEDEKNARMKVENMLNSVIKEKEELAINMNKRLQKKNEIIAYLSANLYKEQTKNTKLAENIERSGKRFMTAIAPKKPVELEKIIISSLLEAEGKVLAIDKQNDLIVINLGSMNNLKSGDKLSVYRGDSFVANAELVKVHDRISAAMILPENSTEDIKVEVNDTVK